MKLTVFEAEQWERDSFDRLGHSFELRSIKDTLNRSNAPEYSDSDIISVFIYSRLDAEVLSLFKNLKLIATRSTGFDHIDLAYCAQKGINVCNVPAYGDNTVAEHVFGLLLSISHNLTDAVERTRKGNFSHQGLMGFDLMGKTIGVFGTGNIGRHVIEMAKGFRMDVLACDRSPKTGLAKGLGFEYLPMEDVLRRSDIITLHLPATPSTFHFLSTPQFEMMKDGVVIINTARGNLIDIKALLRAITDGKVAAVGLDVMAEEPAIMEEAELLRSIAEKKHLDTLLADHILLRLSNVVITPHTAFYTREAVQRILDTTVDNIAAFTAGKPKNIVSPALV